jgi:hypothetical protein
MPFILSPAKEESGPVFNSDTPPGRPNR